MFIPAFQSTITTTITTTTTTSIAAQKHQSDVKNQRTLNMAYNRSTLWKYLHDRYNFSLQVDSQDGFVRDVLVFVSAHEEEEHADGGDDHEVSEFYG